jgi:hypothetical protein
VGHINKYKERNMTDVHNEYLLIGETKEEWPLLTFETEAVGDSLSKDERGPSLVGSLGSSCRYKRFLACLRPSKKYFFLTVH